MTTESPTTCGAAVRSSDWLDAIVCGDCLEEMPKMPAQSVDAIISDLPYGTTACKWDSVIPFAPLWAEWKRLLKPGGVIVLTASQPFTSALVMSNPKLFKYEWIWVKNQPSGMALANRMPMKYHEVVCVFYDRQCTYNKQPASRGSEKAKAVVKNGVRGKHHTVTNGARLNVPDVRYYNPENVNPKSVLEFPCVPNGGGGRLHPTQKPESLMRYLVRTYTNPGDVVLDPCCGSGTTCVAAKQEGRHYTGIEKDPQYAEIAKQRTHETLGMASNAELSDSRPL